MSKRLAGMRANPAGDWTIADIAALCREFGLRCDAPKSGRTTRSAIRRVPKS